MTGALLLPPSLVEATSFFLFLRSFGGAFIIVLGCAYILLLEQLAVSF